MFSTTPPLGISIREFVDLVVNLDQRPGGRRIAGLILTLVGVNVDFVSARVSGKGLIGVTTPALDGKMTNVHCDRQGLKSRLTRSYLLETGGGLSTCDQVVNYLNQPLGGRDTFVRVVHFTLAIDNNDGRQNEHSIVDGKVVIWV